MTRIVAFWPFLELVTGAAGASEVVARGAAQGPPPTRAGGQDDGSYTNSLKLGASPSYPGWGVRGEGEGEVHGIVKYNLREFV